MEENTNLQVPAPEAVMPEANEAIAPDTTDEATPAPTPTEPDASPAEPPTPPTAKESAAVDYSQMSRTELVEAFKRLLDEEVQTIRDRVVAIRDQFNELTKQAAEALREAQTAAEGATEESSTQEDTLAQEFHSLYNQYRTRRQQYHAALEEQKAKNLQAKQALIEELHVLANSEEGQMRAVMDKFNDIQERWKAIGDVPHEHMNDLWQSYHFQIDQFFKKLNINRELRDLDQKRNLEQKMQLCEQAEELIVETSIQKAFKGLQELRARWKEIGAVPAEKNDEIWQRFQAAAAQVEQRRREYYDRRKEEMDNNLLAKQALIDKATELTATTPQTAKEWNDMTTALDEVLTMWKAIGPVTREANEDVWGRFKGIIDRHYEEKKEYFSALREEQNSNVQKKIDLCLKAETIARRTDWKKATEEILELQREWKAIGSTSRKVSDKVWRRFRAACDEFFNRKSEYFQQRKSSEGENLALKEDIIKELREHTFGDNKEENLNAIKEFQRRWAAIGYVPASEKERLQKEFRSLIDGIFEQLKISAREANETAYRDHLRTLPTDKHVLDNERRSLQDNIERLRSDLTLWENNLGFLAASKQADLLKVEFEKKMANTRQQIALLQAKLRIIDDVEKGTPAQPDNPDVAQ